MNWVCQQNYIKFLPFLEIINDFTKTQISAHHTRVEEKLQYWRAVLQSALSLCSWNLLNFAISLMNILWNAASCIWRFDSIRWFWWKLSFLQNPVAGNQSKHQQQRSRQLQQEALITIEMRLDLRVESNGRASNINTNNSSDLNWKTYSFKPGLARLTQTVLPVGKQRTLLERAALLVGVREERTYRENRGAAKTLRCEDSCWVQFRAYRNIRSRELLRIRSSTWYSAKIERFKKAFPLKK